MNRQKVAQAVAKVQAYANCGKPAQAEEWFLILANELGMNHMFEKQPARN